MVRPKKSRKGYLAPFYRKPGGTTGKPRAPPKQRKPLVTIDLMHNAPTLAPPVRPPFMTTPAPGPAHGVSGFATTGTGGAFSAVRSSSGIPPMYAPDPSTSRFNLEVSGNPSRAVNSFTPSRPIADPYERASRINSLTREQQANMTPEQIYSYITGTPSTRQPTSHRSERRYNYDTSNMTNQQIIDEIRTLTTPGLRGGAAPTTPIIPRATRSNNEPTTYGPYTSEPTFERDLEIAVEQTAPYGLPRHQRLQAEQNPFARSSLDRAARQGLYSGDPFMQDQLPRLDSGRPTNIAQGDFTTPRRPLRLQFSPTPSVNPRNADGHQSSGTINNVASINVQTPMGTSTLPVTMDRTTPGVGTMGYSTPATHISFGPPGGPTPGVDGSWTLNIMPGQAQPTLATLAPAADIPIRNNGPGRLGNTSLFATNRGGTGRVDRRMM